MRQALRTVNAVLRAQRELHELPHTRLRSSWQVGSLCDSPARAGHLLASDHRESMWLGDRQRRAEDEAKARAGLPQPGDRVAREAFDEAAVQKVV